MKTAGRIGSASLFLAPNLIGFLAFTLIPVAASLAMAFTDWNLSRHNELSAVAIRFTGLENFREMFWGAEAEHYWTYLKNTLVLMLGIPISIAGSLFLAMCLHEKIPLRSFFRTVIYLPSIISGVALMLLWKVLLRPDGGAINQVLGAIGLPQPGWLASVVWAKPALIIIGIWIGIGGNNMILYMAGLAGIPEELREAASIDGASRWQRFRFITWPQLAPVTFFIVVMSTIGGLQGGFEQARILTQGGPAGATTTLSYYIYQKGFEEYQVGYASAVSLVLLILVMLLTLAYWRFGNQRND